MICWFFTVRHGEIMHLVGVNATEIGALKVMEFLKKQLEDHNIYYGRYFTDKALREVFLLSL